mgnify:CR=1 FL=1
MEILDPHMPPPATVPATIKGMAGAKTAPATAVATPAIAEPPIAAPAIALPAVSPSKS